ncbi:sugar ABC transporter substrate-binding protein [Mesorhizobium sp. ASY16-5R]|uniref:sugar ABC transporter substrate-binding protein n=1 Tax=Mesorhizobium sp. ASY16-5R TaxID=3445772 RepID=UPI003FA06CA3
MRHHMIRLAASAACLIAGLTPLVSVPANAEPYRIAYLAASRPNIFNQAVFEGMQNAAKELGVELEIFDGEFNPSKQFSQVEDVVASGKFNAIAILANDSVGIVPAVEEAIKSGLKVAAIQFPLGPDLDTIAPQIDKLTTTVASVPRDAAKIQAGAVIDHCKDKATCRVVIVISRLIYPFDKRKYDVFLSEFASHPNIKVVATVEGAYDTSISMKGVQDALQANPEIDVVLSIADQQTLGAEVAIEDAGIDLASLYIVSGGGTDIGVDRVRTGAWDANLAEFPASEGSLAVKNLVDALQGKDVPSSVDALTIGGVPSLITKEVLDAHPDFVPEWKG